MKVIGIEIDKKRAICFLLERDDVGNYVNHTSKKRYIDIDDDANNQSLRLFMEHIYELFNEYSPDKIAVVARQTKGKFAASSSSFKLEALIQCYSGVDVTLVTKQSLTAFYKKHEIDVVYDLSYQERAARLAYFLIEKS